MTPLTIRAAQPQEQAAIFNVHQDSVRQLCQAQYSAEQIASWLDGRRADMYAEAIAAGRLWVAEGVEGLLGFVEIQQQELTKLFVAGHGARRGVGQQLLQHALAVMQAAGVTEAYLEATLTAVPFYARHGFVAGEHSFFSHGNSPIQLEIVAMRKNLSEA